MLLDAEVYNKAQHCILNKSVKLLLFCETGNIKAVFLAFWLLIAV